MVGKYCIVLLFFLLVGVVTCKAENYFGDKTDQVTVCGGVGAQGKVESLCIIDFSYSPTEQVFSFARQAKF